MLINLDPHSLGLPSLQCSAWRPLISLLYLPTILPVLFSCSSLETRLTSKYSLHFPSMRLIFISSPAFDLHSLPPSADLLAVAIPVLQYVVPGYCFFRELCLPSKDGSSARVPGRLSLLSSWLGVASLSWKHLCPTVNRDHFLSPSLPSPETHCRLCRAWPTCLLAFVSSLPHFSSYEAHSPQEVISRGHQKGKAGHCCWAPEILELRWEAERKPPWPCTAEEYSWFRIRGESCT